MKLGMKYTTLLCAAVLVNTGCSSDDKQPDQTVSVNGNGDGDGDEPSENDNGHNVDSGVTATAPVYAMMTQVYDADDRTVYLVLSNTLDLDVVSIANGREFPGVANFAAIGGKLLVSSGEGPVITEFEVSDDLHWTEGRQLSFANYPLSDNANFYYQFVLDEHTVYLPFEASSRILWDPSQMKILGTREDSSLVFEQDGLMLEAGGNRNAVHYDGPVLQAFFYHDEDWFRHGTESLVVSYDPQTHEERDVIHVPCPGLSIATQDEAGYTYFSTWGYLGLLALYGEGPAPCVARLTPDLQLDEDWTTDLTEYTDGRYVNNFRYIGNGKAIGNVLHHEELDADFDGPYQPDVGDSVWDSGPQWRFWLFDLEAKTAHPVDGIEVAIGSGAQFAVLDGRTFVFLPFDEWSRTMVYEIDDDGTAHERFETIGDVFKWVRVR